MLTQAIYFNYRIGEISCPTRYFKEASSINFTKSTKYGFGVLWTVMRFLLHKTGIMSFRIFMRDGKKLLSKETLADDKK